MFGIKINVVIDNCKESDKRFIVNLVIFVCILYVLFSVMCNFKKFGMILVVLSINNF